jgi:hypothetical protein
MTPQAQALHDLLDSIDKLKAVHRTPARTQPSQGEGLARWPCA